MLSKVLVYLLQPEMNVCKLSLSAAYIDGRNQLNKNTITTNCKKTGCISRTKIILSCHSFL